MPNVLCAFALIVIMRSSVVMPPVCVAVCVWACWPIKTHRLVWLFRFVDWIRTPSHLRARGCSQCIIVANLEANTNLFCSHPYHFYFSLFSFYYTHVPVPL